MRLPIPLLLAGTVLLAPATSKAQPVPAAMTFALSQETVVWGDELAAVGAVVGVPAGTEVVVETGSGDVWQAVDTAATDDTGAFTVAYAPKLNGFVRAHVPALGAVSAS